MHGIKKHNIYKKTNNNNFQLYVDGIVKALLI